MKSSVKVHGAVSPYDGARIENRYLDRQKDIIAVDKSDLDSIMLFDGAERTLTAFGLFLLSGALWLGLDKALIVPFVLTPILTLCGCCVVFGFIILLIGWRMGSAKRGRIQQIYKETTVRT